MNHFLTGAGFLPAGFPCADRTRRKALFSL
jgi:hypothetical protein